MGKLFTPTNLSSGFNTSNSLNTDLAAIEAALDKCVSRDGEAPNAMNSNLDMNNYNILNVDTIDVETLTLDGQNIPSLSDVVAAQTAALAAQAAAEAAQAAAETAEANAEASASTINLPTISVADAGKLLEVNPTGDGYIAIDSVDTAQITDANVTEAKLATGAVTADKIGASAVTSSKINDGAILTAKIADNAVTLAKLEDGTQGDVLYYGASGAPTRLSAGTSGQVLATQGAGANPQWVDAATGSGPVLLTTATVTAGDTSEDLLDVFSTNSGYKYYRVAIRRLEQDTAAGFTGIRISENGTTAKSGASDYAYQLEQNSYTTVMAYARDPAASAVYLNAISAASGTVTDAVIDFFDPADTTNIKPINFDSVMTNSSTDSRKSSGMGAYTPNNNAITGFQVFTTAGDFAGGTIEVWGSNCPLR